MNNYFLVKNFFNYEKVIPPPENLPKNLKSVYVTDNEENYLLAKNLGWDIVKKTDLFLNITDKFERRKCVAYINSFPLKVVPEIDDANFVFICDSNIVRLWDLYENFVNSCDDKYSLFLTSGYYSENRDNILKECYESCLNERWAYNHDQIRNCTQRYIDELLEKKINLNTLSIVSAKYFGWNLKSQDYKFLSEILYEEYCKNLQGNIILTYMSGIYSNKIYNYHCNDYRGGILNAHNFSA
jgi:hypothetical protein